MNIYFITSSKDKFREAKKIIPEIKRIDLDIPEIQEIDAKKIIFEKLKFAYKKKKTNFFCEDTSLYINSLNGFPGPLIKWFLISLGNEGIVKLLKNYKDKTAIAKTIIGFINKKGKIYFFEGEIKGKIVSPRGSKGFGWDSIFQPDFSNKTLAEMSLEEKNKISMRTIALNKFKEYLKNENLIHL